MKRSKVDPKRTYKVPAALAALVVIGAMVLSPGSEAGGAAGTLEDIVADEVVVEIRPGASIDSVNSRNDTRIKTPMNGTNFYLLKIPHGGNPVKWQKRLEGDPDVVKAYLNPADSSPLVLNGRRTLSLPRNHA